jgi:hypothetical protein
MSVSAYILGLKHGKSISDGKVPIMNINPVKTVIQKVEEHKDKKEADKLSDELIDIMNYSRESALDSIKKDG